MRKKYIQLVYGLFLLLFMVGCGAKKDVTKYIDVTFDGVDTKGTVHYDIDRKQLVEDTLGFSDDSTLSVKQEKELTDLLSGFSVKLSKDSNLSNGDKIKVIVTVNDDKTKKIKSGEKLVEVKGLEKPNVLTSKDVENKLVVNFNGVSGRGVSKIDNMFDQPLSSIQFEFKNDGKLKNGDKAKITLSKEQENQLFYNGYVVEKGFSPEFEVKGLKEVAATAEDIANLEDIKRMIDEEAKRTYKDYSPESSWGRKYEISLNNLLYRQFNTENDSDDDVYYRSTSDTENGNLIGIYTIKEYSGGTESKLEKTLTAIIGYSNIILDSDKKTNVANLEEISTTKDDTYSLESVLKLYEGYGYVIVKN